ncbi:OsmC family protein [Streptomyces sp. NPDC055722]
MTAARRRLRPFRRKWAGPETPPNPGQLCAAGWGSCSLGSVRLVAAERKAKLTSTAITTEITRAQSDHGGFGLAAVLNLELGGMTRKPPPSSATPPARPAPTPRPCAATSPSPSTPPRSDRTKPHGQVCLAVFEGESP